jgi:hypothetical protein
VPVPAPAVIGARPTAARRTSSTTPATSPPLDRQFDLDLDLNVASALTTTVHLAPAPPEPPATNPLPPPPVLAPLGDGHAGRPAFAGSAPPSTCPPASPGSGGRVGGGPPSGRSLVVQADPTPPAGP